MNILAVLSLSLGSLLWATPASASTTIQFTYYWTAQEFTFTDEQVTVVVTNDITNKIGGNGEVIDTYRITLGTQVIEVTEKHGPRPYVFDIVGTQTIKLEGIDNGYWGGNHGPIMDISSTPLAPPTPQPEPNWWAQQNWEGEIVTLTAPEGWEFSSVRAWYGSPDDPTCGQDVSSILGPLMIGQNTITVALDNGTFGDPCGGVVKVTRLTWSIVMSQPVVEPTPTPSPESTDAPVDPTPTPTPTPTLEPTPQPTQTPEPSPQPEPTPSPAPQPEPTIEPTPEPTPSETAEPEPTPEPSLTPEPEPTVEPEPEASETPSPEPPIEEEPEPELTPEPETILPEAPEEIISELLTVAPEDLTKAQVEQLVEAALETFETAEQGSPAYEQALEALAVAAEADDPEVPSELAAIPLLGDVAGAALEVFNNLGNVGADMAPAVREEAEKTVIASVIATGAAVNAVAAAATSAASTSSSGSAGGASSGGSSGGSGSTRRKE